MRNFFKSQAGDTVFRREKSYAVWVSTQGQSFFWWSTWLGLSPVKENMPICSVMWFHVPGVPNFSRRSRRPARINKIRDDMVWNPFDNEISIYRKKPECCRTTPSWAQGSSRRVRRFSLHEPVGLSTLPLKKFLLQSVLNSFKSWWSSSS